MTRGFALTGIIPSETGELTALAEVRLGKYLILQGSYGAVEAFYSCFHGLILFNCLTQQRSTGYNDLIGSIPSEIGELTALTELRLGKYLILQGSNGGVEAFFARC